MSAIDTGRCEHCRLEFHYRLIHNGFNDSYYAYCERCGRTALLSFWTAKLPPATTGKRVQGLLPVELEPCLTSCECGGRFRSGVSPRCPYCQSELSAESAASYIEENAPGTAKGWRWQRNWTGLYCLVIEDRFVEDNVLNQTR